VGLAQREIEAAGFSTMILSPIPEVSAAVSVPRLAGISYPLGRSFGPPGDAAGQTAVLRATLQALADIQTPGGMVELPFEWPEPPDEALDRLEQPPPIVQYLQHHPLAVVKLIRRTGE
jgi:betaine reductase